MDLMGLDALTLSGLERDDAATLLNRAAATALPPAVVTRLVVATGGNPLALLEAPGALPSAQLAEQEPRGARGTCGRRPGPTATPPRRSSRLH